jgi:hypothetical protein
VGSKRKIILAKKKTNLFLAPDNGLLSFVLKKTDSFEIFEINKKKYFLGQRSTFDGRDVFAPVAAHISRGEAIISFGKKTKKFVKMKISPVKKIGKKFICEIIYIDHFGNCWSNLKKGNFKPKKAVSGNVKILRFSKNYCDKGKDTMLFNSFSFLEFATGAGNFARKHKIKRGSIFEVEVE